MKSFKRLAYVVCQGAERDYRRRHNDQLPNSDVRGMIQIGPTDLSQQAIDIGGGRAPVLRGLTIKGQLFALMQAFETAAVAIDRQEIEEEDYRSHADSRSATTGY